MKEGKFREDLYYRLNVLEVHPALRERREDIPGFWRITFKGVQARPVRGSEGRRSRPSRSFLEYDWPGNIRQLKNVAERVAVLYREPVVERLARQALVGRAEGRRPRLSAPRPPAPHPRPPVPRPPPAVRRRQRPARVCRHPRRPIRPERMDSRADRPQEREEILLAYGSAAAGATRRRGCLASAVLPLWRRMRKCGLQGESQNSSISDIYN